MSAVFPIDPDARWRSYTASGGQTAFSIPFPFQDDDDIAVLKVALDGTVTALSNPADYSVAGAGNPAGGSFLLASGALAGERFRPIGAAVLERVMSIVRGGKYKSSATDSDLDRLMIIAQEARRDIDRTVTSPLGEAGLELPDYDAGKALAWDEAERKLVNTPVSPGDITSAIEEAEDLRDETADLKADVVVLKTQTQTIRDGAATDAAAAIQTAQDWAVKATDVTPGNPSAKTSAALATAKAILTAADVVTTNATAALVTMVSNAAGFFPNAAATNVPRGISKTVGAITPGAGGANGTFALAWTGGNFAINPTGTFTVTGGALTAVAITGQGLYIGGAPTAPTPSFAASAGLAGAGVALTADFIPASGQGYWALSADGLSNQLYQNSAGAPAIVAGLSVPTKASVDAVLALLTQPSNVPYAYVMEDGSGRIAMAVQPNGEVLIDKLKTKTSRHKKVNSAGVGIRSLVAVTDAMTTDIQTGLSGQFAVEDDSGRQALALSSDGISMPAIGREVGSLSRGRSAGSGSIMVYSKRRSALSRNFDLYAIDMSAQTPIEVRLTSDGTDKWDFGDPAIVGSDCWFTARLGRRSELRWTPLTGGLVQKPVFPDDNIVLNGDSFTNAGVFLNGLNIAFSRRRSITSIGVGGTTVAQQTIVLTNNPRFWRSKLIIMDGGNSDGDGPVADNITAIQTQLDTLQSKVKQWCWVEPSPQAMLAGSPERAAFDLRINTIDAAFPGHLVRCLTELKAANDGSAGDLADVANNIVPRSIRIPGDPIHEGAVGLNIRAAKAVAFFESKGW